MAKSSRVSSYIPDQGGTPKRSKSKSILILLCVVVLLGVAALFGGKYYLETRFAKAGPNASETVFSVPRGAGASSIASKLERENLISNADYFKLMVRLQGEETGLKAGEYAIPAAASLRDIYKTLSDGKAILYPFTAPEGLTSAQIVRAMEGMPTLLNDNPATPLEGTLLPETYLTPRGMSHSALIRKMQKAQTDFLNKAWQNRAPNLPIKTKAEALILASVVEKETGIGSERDKVAGVFTNRLNRGMRLESDPTIIYGINGGERLGRGIRRSEINRKTDWNTYQIDGLPKTPICNPGKDAILAVLNPATTDAIFFVADGTGGHAFASTLAGHNANVREWRKIERQRKAQKQ